MRAQTTWARRADVSIGLLVIALIVLAIPLLQDLRSAPQEAETAAASAMPRGSEPETALLRVSDSSDLELPFLAKGAPDPTASPSAAAAPSATPSIPPTPMPVATDDLSFENPPPPPPPPDPTPVPVPTQPPGALLTPPPPAPTRTPTAALPGETIVEDEYFTQIHKSGTFRSTVTIREVTMTASRVPAGADPGQCPVHDPPAGMVAVGLDITVTWSAIYLDMVHVEQAAQTGMLCWDPQGPLISGYTYRYWYYGYAGAPVDAAVNVNNGSLSYWWHWTD